MKQQINEKDFRKETTYIVIHCAATPPSMDIDISTVDRWHRAKGWLGVGYHFFIKRDGTIQEGRNVMLPGAHVRGYNHCSVGVCMAGGVKESDKVTPENNFTDAQWLALNEIINKLQQQFPDAKVVGHNELAAKACPSFDVQAWLKSR